MSYPGIQVDRFKEKILSILTDRRPALEELTTWSEIIQELRTYFDWKTIKDIIDIIFDEMDIIKHNSEASEETIEERAARIEEAVMDGLNRWLPPGNQ